MIASNLIVIIIISRKRIIKYRTTVGHMVKELIDFLISETSLVDREIRESLVIEVIGGVCYGIMANV